jgi:hypothetical protein
MSQPAYRVTAAGPAGQKLDRLVTTLEAAAQCFIDWVAVLHYHHGRDPVAELREVDDLDDAGFASDPGTVIGYVLHTGLVFGMPDPDGQPRIMYDGQSRLRPAEAIVDLDRRTYVELREMVFGLLNALGVATPDGDGATAGVALTFDQLTLVARWASDEGLRHLYSGRYDALLRLNRVARDAAHKLRDDAGGVDPHQGGI